MKLNSTRMSSRIQVTFLWISVTVLICIIHACLGAGDEAKKNGDIHDTQAETNSILVSSISITKYSGNSHVKAEIPRFECHGEEKECEKDRLGFDAIRNLHLMIDDDHNGNVDLSESDEFLRDELQYTDGFERQELFHNNDKLISVDDLWKAWKHSAVYNWTVDDVIEWLVEDVQLPQYSQVFHNFAVDGSVLPRLVNATSPLLMSLGIRNPVHKQKLSLKAMDTVLFGAPKRLHNYAKDVLLVMAILLAIGISWFAYLHHRFSQTQVKKMMKDLESLQKAEDALKKISKELADAEKNRISLPPEKQEELRMLRQNSLRLQVPRLNTGDKSPTRLNKENRTNNRQEGELKLQQAQEELVSLREALSEAENRLEIHQQLESHWSVPGELQAWMQLTHELEQSHFNAKRQAAERQLLAARDGCEKIKKRKQAFFGSLRMAHSNSLDDIDQSILDARAALEEVKQDLQERLHRWHTIEILCGFPIISNSGLSALKQALGRDAGGSTRLPSSLLAPVSFEEADEDSPCAGYTSTALPASGKTSSFHKQQQTPPGSTVSLPHLSKVSSSVNAGGASVKSGNREGEGQGVSSGTPPTTVTAGFAGSSVIFQLGESSHHQRSNSSASLSFVNSNLTNVSHHGHVQGKTGSSQINHSTMTSTMPPALRVSSSSGNLLGNNSSARAGSLSAKMFSSASGNHLSARASLPQSSTPSSAAAKSNLEATNDMHHLNDTSDVNNIYTAYDSGSEPDAVPTSASDSASVINSHWKSNLLENSDTASLGSLSRNQSNSLMAKGKLDRSPELDLSSLETESSHDSRNGGNGVTVEKKNGKKKTLIPKFLQKSKKKQKTS